MFVPLVLFQELCTDCLKDRNSWETFRNGSALAMPHTVPLPASTSKGAKGMRLVITLAIISREIDKHIFQPNYLDLDDNRLRSLLTELATTDGDKESFCRAMLLSVDETAQIESSQSRISRISRNVTHNLFGSLPGSEQDVIRQTISKIAERAIKVWIPLQHANLKYEPDFEPLDWNDPEWTFFVFPGEKAGNAETETGPPIDNPLTIFPRLSRVVENQRYHLTFVTQIGAWHPLWTSAEQEMSRSPSSPTARKPSTGTRRPSISNSRPNGTNGKKTPNGRPV